MGIKVSIVAFINILLKIVVLFVYIAILSLHEGFCPNSQKQNTRSDLLYLKYLIFTMNSSQSSDDAHLNSIGKRRWNEIQSDSDIGMIYLNANFRSK